MVAGADLLDTVVAGEFVVAFPLAGVADDWRVSCDVFRLRRRPNDDAASGHALTDVVVSISDKIQIQSCNIPDAKTLPRRTR